MEIGRKHQVPVQVTGLEPLLHIGFDHPEAAALGTLMTVRLLAQGFLAGSGFYPSLAHEERHIDSFLNAANGVFEELAQAIEQDDIGQRINGAVRHTGFTRLT